MPARAVHEDPSNGHPDHHPPHESGILVPAHSAANVASRDSSGETSEKVASEDTPQRVRSNLRRLDIGDVVSADLLEDLRKIGDLSIRQEHAVRRHAHSFIQHRRSALLRGEKVSEWFEAMSRNTSLTAAGSAGSARVRTVRSDSSPATKYRWAGDEPLTVTMSSLPGASLRTRDHSESTSVLCWTVANRAASRGIERAMGPTVGVFCCAETGSADPIRDMTRARETADLILFPVSRPLDRVLGRYLPMRTSRRKQLTLWLS